MVFPSLAPSFWSIQKVGKGVSFGLVSNLTGCVFTFGTLRIVSDAEAGKISSPRLFQPSLAYDLVV